MSFTDNIDNLFEYFSTIPDNETKVSSYISLIEDFGFDNSIGKITSTPNDVVYSYFRQRTLIALIRCISNIQYVSSSDAIEIMTQVKRLIDAEIKYCFDNSFQDVGYIFNQYLAQLSNYIANVSAKLPSIITAQLKSYLPACVIAHQYYQDATRDDEIIQRNNPEIGSSVGLEIELLQY